MVGAMSGNKTGHSVGTVPCFFVESESVASVGAERVGLVVGGRA